MQCVQFEREVAQRLPGVLAELFDEPGAASISVEHAHDVGADFLLTDSQDRQWLVEAKTSSSPGVVKKAADQLKRYPSLDAIQVLVVPYMTQAGAKAADALNLNWIDLSGNARLRHEGLYIRVEGQPNSFVTPGRPASPFAPKSSRVTRAMLLDPKRWWRQKDLAESTRLDPGNVSRVVRRLDDDALLERDGSRLRPRDPDLLLDAWADDYRFDRHDILTGHFTGKGVELARSLHKALNRGQIKHAFTGLPAAWAINGFARFRLASVYVHGDPRTAADAIGLRLDERGANVQLIGPDDLGVFDGEKNASDLPCVSAVQVYLDLGHLPERAAEAANQLRKNGGLWHGRN